MWDPFAEFETSILDNGLEIHAAHWAGRLWQQIYFVIKAGACHDEPGTEGTAHFLEHLVFNNAGMPKKDFNKFFKALSGEEPNAGTTLLDTFYPIFIPTDDQIVKKTLSMYATMLLQAQIVNEIERERQVVIAEFYEHDQFEFEFANKIRKHQQLYAGHWQARSFSPGGYIHTIEQISMADLQTFYDKYYVPSNMAVITVGGLTSEQVVNYFKDSLFSEPKQGMVYQPTPPASEITRPTEKQFIFEAAKHFADPSHLRTGAFERTALLPGSIKASVQEVFCNMLNEILNEEIREKRSWVYSVFSQTQFVREFYEFFIATDSIIKKQALEQFTQVVEECVQMIRQKNGLFERAKQSSKMREQMLDLSAGGLCELAKCSLLENNRIKPLVESMDNIDQVSFEEVEELIELVKPDNCWTRIDLPYFSE